MRRLNQALLVSGVLLLLLALPSLTNVGLAQLEEDPQAVLTVHVEASGVPVAGVPVQVATTVPEFVKVDNGVYTTPFSTVLASTTTDANGDAKFDLVTPAGDYSIAVTVTTCGQTINMNYVTAQLVNLPPPTPQLYYTLNVECGDLHQAIPEVPWVGTLGIGLIMIGAFLFKQRRNIKI